MTAWTHAFLNADHQHHAARARRESCSGGSGVRAVSSHRPPPMHGHRAEVRMLSETNQNQPGQLSRSGHRIGQEPNADAAREVYRSSVG